MLAADYIVVAAAADGCRYKRGHVVSLIGFVAGWPENRQCHLETGDTKYQVYWSLET